MIFTKEELEQYNINQLRNLASYFRLDFDMESSKGRLIEQIYTHLEREHITNSVPASARVRRIRESQKEK